MILEKLIPEYVREGFKTIGVWCSGGADSSLLLYLLTKEIIEDKLDIELIPLTMRRARPQNPFFASQVIEFLETHFGKPYKDHLIFYPTYTDQEFLDVNGDMHFFTETQAKLIEEGVIDFIYSATSMTPPLEAQEHFQDKLPDDILKTRDPEDLNKTMWHKVSAEPLINVNKKELAEIYKKEGLLDTLFPLTRSCENSELEFIYKHCGSCWWCEERKWAFGRLE
jgi:hypothetical protein